MQKPNNYDQTKAGGDFTPVELGGHHLVIKQVSEKKSKNGKDMIVVLFDFAQKDAQAGYFMEQFENDIRPEKKWPNQATQYILVNDENGNTSRNFKTFTTCVEHSNPGFETKWGIDNWGAQFKGKDIGGVFGEQLDFYGEREMTKRVLRWFVSSDKVEGADIPNVTETAAYKNRGNSTTLPKPDANGFMNIPDGIDEELPFN